MYGELKDLFSHVTDGQNLIEGGDPCFSKI